MKKDFKIVVKRGIALLLVLALMIPMEISMENKSLKASAASGSTVGDVLHFDDKIFQPEMNITYKGKVRSFAAGEDRYIDVTAPFDINLTAPTDMDMSETRGISLYLISYSAGNDGIAFLEGPRYRIEKGSPSLTYRSGDGCFESYTDEAAQIVDFSILDPALGLPASGPYYIAAVLECFDNFTESISDYQNAPYDGYLICSTLPVRVSNPDDGGYLGDEYYGVVIEEEPEYVDLNVTVYLGFNDETTERCKITVYSEDLSTCYGYAPCKVMPGEKVALSLTPENDGLAYYYDFGNTKNGTAYIVEVPDDGCVEVRAYPYEKGAELCGYVYDENSNPISDVTVSVAMKTSDMLSESVKTDLSGRFRFQGIYNNDDAVVYFSKNGYYSVDQVISKSELYEGNVVTRNVTLHEKEAAFSLHLPENINPSYAEILTRVSLEGLKVYDESGEKVVSGTFRTKDGKILFSPEKISGVMPSYTVKLLNPQLGEIALTVGRNQDEELPVNAGAVTFHALLENNQYGYVFAEIFDDSGRSFYEGSGMPEITEDGVLLPEGNYQLFFYASPQYLLNGDEISDLKQKEAQLLSFSVKNGKVSVLGDIRVPYVNMQGNNPFAGKSFLTVPAELTPTDEYFTISGHIEADTSDFEITALRIYAMNDYVMNDIGDTLVTNITAAFENGTLAIDGKLVPVSSYGGAETIELQTPVSEACDFSARLHVNNHVAMIVTVQVDAVVEGNKMNNLSLGEYYVSGDKVTLEAFDTTATGEVYCSGFAFPDSEVVLYDQENRLQTVQADKYGKWTSVIILPKNNGYPTTHKLKAVCNGVESAVLPVYYSENCAALSGIYLASGVIRYSDSYIWYRSSKFRCEADVQNADCINEDPEFAVLCSDGTVLMFEAKKGETRKNGDIPVTTYYSEEYDFGANNLLPIRVWFEYKQEFIKQQPSEPLPTKLVIDDSILKFRNSNVEYKEQTGIPNLDEIGDELAVTLIMYETTKEKLEEMEDEGADYYQAYDDDNKIVMGEYIKDIESGVRFGIIDFEEDTCYIVELFIYDSQNYPSILKEYTSKTYVIWNNYRYASANGNQNTAGNRNAVDTTFFVGGEAWKEGVGYGGDKLVEFIANTIRTSNDPLVKKAAPYEKKVGVGNLMDGYEISVAAGELYEREQTASENKDLLSFIIRSSWDLPGGSGKKVESMANQARNDYIRATDSTSKNFGTRIMATIASEAASKVPAGGEVVSATKFTGLQGAVTEASDAYADADWAFAEQEFRETLLEFMKASGLSKDEMMELYSKYKDGQMSLKQVGDYINNKLRNKSRNSGNSRSFTGTIDPSGYVYEAVASNRIEGATVTLYSEGMLLFEAEAYGQVNPLTSDSEGRYAWDVPEGNWFVKVYKNGYEMGDSQNDPAATVTIDGINYLPVLPPQLDVNIGITSTENPKASLTYRDGSWYLIFDRYIEVDTIGADAVRLESESFTATSKLNLIATDEEMSPLHTPICGGKMLARTFRLEISGALLTADEAITVSVESTVLGYNGKSAAQRVTANGGYRINEHNGTSITVIIVSVVVAVVLIAGIVTVVVVVRKKRDKK